MIQEYPTPYHFTLHFLWSGCSCTCSMASAPASYPWMFAPKFGTQEEWPGHSVVTHQIWKDTTSCCFDFFERPPATLYGSAANLTCSRRAAAELPASTCVVGQTWLKFWKLYDFFWASLRKLQGTPCIYGYTKECVHPWPASISPSPSAPEGAVPPVARLAPAAALLAPRTAPLAPPVAFSALAWFAELMTFANLAL